MQISALVTHAAHSDGQPEERRAPGRVLLVDRPGERRDAIAEVMRQQGFAVIESEHGEPLLEAARTFLPDVVALDTEWSGHNGSNVCHRIRTSVTPTPAILHLASGGPASATHPGQPCAESDGDLADPCDAAAVRRTIGSLVRLARSEAARATSAALNTLLLDTLDALPDHVALLGAAGDVLAVNRAWTVQGHTNGFCPSSANASANFGNISEHDNGVDAEQGRETVRGIQRVLAGELPGFDCEYACKSNDVTRWFNLHAQRLRDAGQVVAIIVISDCTTEQRAAQAQRQARAEAEAERERLHNALEMERSRLAAIFQRVPGFLAVLRGPEYVFERVNAEYLQLVGHRDPVGKTLLGALPEIRGQGFVELLDEVRRTGEPFVGRHMPVQLARVPGAALETRFVDMLYQRFLDIDGEYALVAHGVDVTEQRDSQLASAHLAAIIHSATEAIISADMDGRVTSWNPEAERLFGYSREEIVGRHLSLLHPKGITDSLPSSTRSSATAKSPSVR